MHGGESLPAEVHGPAARCWSVQGVAAAHLAAGLSEIVGQESIEDGVDAGISIGQAVRHDA